MMFVAMLRAQWIWSRPVVLFFLLAAFAVPLAAVVISATFGEGFSSSSSYLMVGYGVGTIAGITLCTAAVAIALQNWAADERGSHIYALSLPIERRRYLLNRLGGGFLLVLLVSAALGVGGLIASLAIELPEELHTYPLSLASRALLAAWLTHAVAFAFRFGAGRRAGIVALGVLCVTVALVLMPVFVPSTSETIAGAWHWLLEHPGPFGILSGRWNFIDV
jgi:hypothetical protein